MKSKLTTGGHARPAATSRPTPIHALGAAGEGPRPSDPQRPICECGHPRADHEDCGNGLIVCFHRTGPPGDHPFDGVCTCCNYADEAERTCACGCGRSLEGRRANTRYALPSCRVRGHRKRYESVTGPGRRGGPSGLQISYRKAVNAAALALFEDGYVADLSEAGRWAEVVIAEGLSDRQRARLDERRTA